jgi:hypothetical protein
LNNLIDIFKQKVKLLLNADSVHVILVDKFAIDVFNKENRGYTQPVKIDNVTYFRAMENRGGKNKKNSSGDDFKDTLFNTLEEAYDGV